jgi:tetratricopeptide (TPR) repeat protein
MSYSLIRHLVRSNANFTLPLENFAEAAQECKIVLDTVEAALLQCTPEAIIRDSKMHETVSKAVELLPEIWKQAGALPEAMAAYRRALLNPWALDSECSGRIQKQFSIMLLYSGVEVGPPSLGSQVEGSYIPKSNIEEAILLLLILLRKISLKKIPWDPTIMDHLTFALSMSGQLGTLANQVEELLPRIYNRADRWYTLALCYSGGGQDEVALNLFKKSLGPSEKPDFIPSLLLASKICGQSSKHVDEGVLFAKRAIEIAKREDDCMKGVANYLLAVALGKQSKSAISDTERAQKQTKALTALKKAASLEKEDPKMLLRLSLENAEQRNLNVALDYARKSFNMEAGSSIRGWRLLALILSAQQQFSEAETVIDTALDQTGKWEQGVLLRTKAKLQIARSKSKDAIKTYGQLLALVQAQKKSFGAGDQRHRVCIYTFHFFDTALISVQMFV